MKIILCGKNDAAVACLEYLAAQRDQVWAIGVKGDDGVDGWQRSLKAAADRLGVTFAQPAKINEPAFIKQLADFGAAVLVSIQYDQILRDPLFNAIGCPCVNLHFALLPRHRGVAPIAWAVMAGDTEAGVTLHHMIEDIDAGDVVAQRAVPIEPDDTARQVYDKVSDAAAALFGQFYPFSAGQLAQRLEQDGSVASYHRNGDFDFAVKTIDWRRPAHELHRWIRAMIFPPFQYPQLTVDQRTLGVTSIATQVTPCNSAAPGAVTNVSDQAIDIAAGDAAICVTGVIDEITQTWLCTLL